MNILLINHFPFMGSGSGVYVKNIAENLVKNGNKVCVIMPENTTKIEKILDVKIHPVFFKNKEMIEGQLSFNFPCFDPHPRSSMNFIHLTDEQVEEYEKAFREAIEEEIKEFKPDVIHSGHIWIISSIATKYDIPVIITCHGSDIMGYNESNRFHNYANDAANGCKKIIAISKHNKEVLENTYTNKKDDIIIIPNGYNPNMFYREKCNKQDILKSLKIYKEFSKIVCFAGRLAKNKGVDILLNSAKIYEKENVLTLIVGHGSEYNELFPLKEKLGLKNVVFLGDKTQEELRKIYSISDVCAVPSREEAFGLVALEALACGVPVVATRQGGIPDFINEKVGILVQKENVQELAEAINKILNEEIKFDEEVLQNYARNNYSEELLINKLLDLYKEVKE